MVKAAVLVCVMVLGWTLTLQGYPVEEEEGSSMASYYYALYMEEEMPITEAPTEMVPTEVVPTVLHFNRTEMCSMAPKRGPCKAKLRRHFYNSTSASCEVFFYGGCGGNMNNFRTEEKCLESCGAEDEPTHAPLVVEAQTPEAN